MVFIEREQDNALRIIIFDVSTDAHPVQERPRIYAPHSDGVRHAAMANARGG
jgi:hypothetical protein